MTARILSLVAQTVELNPNWIKPDRQLVEYGLDSARAMDLVVALLEAFNLSIPDDVARGLRSVDDIVRYVNSQLETQ